MRKKQKVIRVSYREDSKTFPDWLKYEITLLNEDGTTENVPAYGKDLQDALSRVVHDKKVETVSKVVNKIPSFVWPGIWILSLSVFSFYMINTSAVYSDNGVSIFVTGIIGISTLTYLISNWFELKNKNLNG